MEILTKIDGIILLVGYFVVMMAITRMTKRGESTAEGYLVANRTISSRFASLSIAATWIWAPSMFIASEKAYTQGLAGVFWFVVPNILALVLFAFFANKMRQLRPNGWTFSDFIREKYSKRTHNLYLIESFGLQVLSLAVQLLAGATILSKLTGLSFTGLTVAMALIPLVYTFKSGIRASITTDFWQMLWIAVVLLVGLPIILSNAGVESLTSGLGGITGGFDSLISKNGLEVALSFGLPTTIGLLSGTFGDQMFWQRVFSIKEGGVKKSILWASAIFAIVPVSLALFGFIASGAGLDIADTQLVNVGAVIAFAPKWFLWLFLTMILSGLLSTVDSILCAVSSVAGRDIIERAKAKYGVCEDSPVFVGQLAMVNAVLCALLIANIPNLTILHLFLFYGTLRSSVMLPTIFAIKGIKMSERGLFWGIIVSICVGLPVFAIGNLSGNTAMIVSGSLITILASGFISLINREQPKEPKPMVLTVKLDADISQQFNSLIKPLEELTAVMNNSVERFQHLHDAMLTMHNNLKAYKVKRKQMRKIARKHLKHRR